MASLMQPIAVRPFLVLALVTACAPAVPTASPASPTASTPAQATATPAPAAAPLPEPGKAIPPGRYAYNRFDPPITLDLDGSWESNAQRDAIFNVVSLSDEQLATVWVAIVDGVRGAGGTVVQPTTADEAVAAIQENSRVDVVETSESRMGGLDGAQVTVERPGTHEPGVIDVVPVLGAGDVGIVLGVGGRFWIAFFEAPQGLIAVIVGGKIERWDAALAAAEPVLESITFGAP